LEKPIIIKIPQQIGIESESYNFLGFVYATLVDLKNKLVYLDFEICLFFEGNMCAVLGSILEDAKLRGNKIFLTNVPPNIKGFMFRNKFLKNFDNNREELPINNSSIYYQKFVIEDEIGVKNYVEQELFNKQGMPEISHLLKKEIVKSIFEIYANALTHGRSFHVFSCGQVFARRSPPVINFTFVDLGRTIKSNVDQYLNSELLGHEAILWATSNENSTKVDNHSGGLGLKLIKNFIRLNRGKFQIVSGTGFWEETNERTFMMDISNSFPGTIVNLVFNLSDQNKYYLAGELPPAENPF